MTLSSLARKAVGLMLVFAAMSSVAHAGVTPPSPSVPEIDPGSILSAVTLLSGGLMVLADRRRKK